MPSLQQHHSNNYVDFLTLQNVTRVTKILNLCINTAMHHPHLILLNYFLPNIIQLKKIIIIFYVKIVFHTFKIFAVSIGFFSNIRFKKKYHTTLWKIAWRIIFHYSQKVKFNYLFYKTCKKHGAFFIFPIYLNGVKSIYCVFL